MQDVEHTIFGIIAGKAKVDAATISRDTELAGLNLDSIDTIETIFEIEETFDIGLMFNANQSIAEAGIVTAGNVVDLVEAQLKSRNAPKS